MEAKDDGGDEELVVDHGPGLVHRFVNFAFKTINNDMNGFFEENCDKFEQEFDNYQKQGETLEQYACYSDYKRVLEGKLDEFVQSENFDDDEECMFEIQRLIKEDLERHKEQMEKLMANLLRAQKRAIKAIKKAQKEQSGELDNLSDDEASDSDAEDKGEGKDDDDGGLGSMMVFFQPTTLEQLVEMVMNLGEYQTFSMMMRMKVQQKRVLKLLMEARDGGEFNALLGGGALGGGGGEAKGEAKESAVKVDDVKIEAEDDFFFTES